MNNKFNVGDIVLICSKNCIIGIVINDYYYFKNQYDIRTIFNNTLFDIPTSQLKLFTKDDLLLKIERLNNIEKINKEEYSANIYLKDNDDIWLYRFHIGNMNQKQLIDKAYNKAVDDLKIKL
ncbi:MAG: hypothetical protein ACFFG0_05290 [Candidatus Thorarchaeota archaeon]